MEPQTLDLLDFTVSQSVLMLHQALETSGGEALEVIFQPEELFRDNLLRVAAQRGRRATLRCEAGAWVLALEAATTVPVLSPLPAPAVIPSGHGPLVVSREALGGGGSGLGRRLLLGTLRQLPPETPWVVLILDGLRLLEDAEGRAALAELQARGIPVRMSRESSLLVGEAGDGFEPMEDVLWQRALAGGQARLL